MLPAAALIVAVAVGCFLIADERLRRTVLVWAPLLLVSFSANRVSAVLGAPSEALVKAVVLAMWLFAAVAVGASLARAAVAPILGWGVALAVTLGLGSPLVGLSTIDNLVAFGGYVYPFVAFIVHWNALGPERVARVIVALPWVSIALGFALQAVGGGTVIRPEFTGVPRLQGALIPAHLAMLAFAATVASCWLLVRRYRGAAAMAFASVAVCFATGTRAASAASLIVLGATLLSGRAKGVQRVVGLGFGIAIVAIFLPLLQQRSASFGNDAFNTSGRVDAWQFWIRAAEQAPYFGRGIGASLELAESGITRTRALENFVVPHNMYLQVWLDAGYVGAAAVAVGLLVAWRVIARTADPAARPVLRATALALLLYSVVDNTLVTPHLIVPVVTLLAVVAAAGSGREDEVRHGRSSVRRRDRLRAGQVGQPAHGRRQPGGLAGLRGNGSRHAHAGNLQRTASEHTQ